MSSTKVIALTQRQFGKVLKCIRQETLRARNNRQMFGTIYDTEVRSLEDLHKAIRTQLKKP